MGNKCQGCDSEWTRYYRQQTASMRMALQSWELLRQQQGLPSILHQPNTVKQILATIQKHPIRATVSLPFSDLHLMYNNNLFLYVGKVKQQRLSSKKAWVVLPRKKVYYVGSVRENWISGEGEASWQASGCHKSVRVIAKGKWEVGEIKVKLYFNSSPLRSNMVHSLYKEQLQVQNWMYMQLPNYDEYIGQVIYGKAHGIGTYVYRGGNQSACYPFYFGRFKEGERHGQGRLHYSENMVLQVVWVRNKPEGEGKIFLKGATYPVLYEKGRRKSKVISTTDAGV